MKVELKSDNSISDIASVTGKSLEDWFAVLDGKAPIGRRDAISQLYDAGMDVWWATTIWVEWERARGIVNKKDGLGEGYNICCTKTVAASADRIYQAFPGLLGQTSAKEGANFDANGNAVEWLRCRPGKDLRARWRTAGCESDTLVDAAFAEKNGKTGITVTHARIQSREEADGLRAAWGAALDGLKKNLEG